MDVSKILPHDVFNKIYEFISPLPERIFEIMIVVSWVAITFYIFYLLYHILPYTYIHQVWSGDAMANQLMQLIMQVVRNLKRDSNPPILLLLPLGSKANISFSLGWVS